MKRWIITLGAAAIVGATSMVAHAQLLPSHNVPPRSAGAVRADQLTTMAAEAEMAGNAEGALKLAEGAVAANPVDPWAYYDRADALATLQRTDDAVASFRQAEERFLDSERWGKSVAIYGQALALAAVGRCDEARPLYERYVSYVVAVDAQAADMARRYAQVCRPRRASR